MGEHDRIELVAVEDQQSAAVGGMVDRLLADLDAAEIDAANWRNISS